MADPCLRIYNNPIRVYFDPFKREKALEDRGLDFEDAVAVVAGLTV